jgi:cytochrome P450
MSETNAPLSPIDITSPAFKANPHPVFARWRQESPVVRVNLHGPAAGAAEAFLVTRYSDVSTLLKNNSFVKQPDLTGSFCTKRFDRN